MALEIRDEAIDALAAKVKRALGVDAIEEAVRTALEHELERLRASKTFEERIAGAVALADLIGPPNTDFNEKEFMDEMWEDTEQRANNASS